MQVYVLHHVYAYDESPIVGIFTSEAAVHRYMAENEPLYLREASGSWRRRNGWNDWFRMEDFEVIE